MHAKSVASMTKAVACVTKAMASMTTVVYVCVPYIHD